MTDERPRRLWWIPPAICIVVGLPLFLKALTWRLHVENAPVHLTPLALRQIHAVSIALPTLPGLMMLWLAISRRVEWKAVTSLIATLVLGLAGAVVLIKPEYQLFHTEEVMLSVRSSDGSYEAHVFHVHELLSCRYALFLSEPGALFARATRETVEVSCTMPGGPSVRWLEDGGATIALDGGQPPEPLSPLLLTTPWR